MYILIYLKDFFMNIGVELVSGGQLSTEQPYLISGYT